MTTQQPESKFAQSINQTGTNVIDTLAGSAKLLFGAASNLLGGGEQLLHDSLNVVDSAVSDLTLPTVDSITKLGVNTAKNTVALGYNTVKEVAGGLKEGGVEMIAEFKQLMPKSAQANVVAAQPVREVSVDERMAQLANTEQQAEAVLEAAHNAKNKLINSQEQ